MHWEKNRLSDLTNHNASIHKIVHINAFSDIKKEKAPGHLVIRNRNAGVTATNHRALNGFPDSRVCARNGFRAGTHHGPLHRPSRNVRDG